MRALGDPIRGVLGLRSSTAGEMRGQRTDRHVRVNDEVDVIGGHARYAHGKHDTDRHEPHSRRKGYSADRATPVTVRPPPRGERPPKRRGSGRDGTKPNVYLSLENVPAVCRPGGAGPVRGGGRCVFEKCCREREIGSEKTLFEKTYQTVPDWSP